MNTLAKAMRLRSQMCQLPCMRQMAFRESGFDDCPATELIPAGYVIQYSNDHRRSVIVKLLCMEDKEVVMVKIRNDQNGDCFALVDWLKRKGNFKSYKLFHLATYPGEFSQRVAGFLVWLADIFGDADLASMLTGSHWEEIPFDWAGMK